MEDEWRPCDTVDWQQDPDFCHGMVKYVEEVREEGFPEEEIRIAVANAKRLYFRVQRSMGLFYQGKSVKEILRGE